jgi:hypothetical protein
LPLLFRRREIWWPTASGALLILAFVAGTGWALAMAAHDFFAINEPVVTADGRGARVLIVEGWVGENDLDDVVELFKRGHYEHVFTAGGPIPSWSPFKTYADRAADYLRTHGLDAVPVVSVPSPPTLQDRTFVSAVWVRDAARRAGVPLTQVDVFTHDVHARRTRLLYRMAFGPEVAVGIMASTPQEYDTKRWWTNSYALKTLLGEAISLAWTNCCFWPGAQGTHQERWGLPESAR